jgi:hypothetical protein
MIASIPTARPTGRSFGSSSKGTRSPAHEAGAAGSDAPHGIVHSDALRGAPKFFVRNATDHYGTGDKRVDPHDCGPCRQADSRLTAEGCISATQTDRRLSHSRKRLLLLRLRFSQLLTRISLSETRVHSLLALISRGRPTRLLRATNHSRLPVQCAPSAVE